MVPQKQKAWLIVRQGEPRKALKLDESWPVPTKLSSGEVLVKVQAAAFNPNGYKLMAILPNHTCVAENDFAGVVVDANGTDLQEGQEVYGWIPEELQLSSKQGAFCEYVRVPARLVLPKPAHVRTTEAAGLAMAGNTAYRALFHELELQPGQRLFINGGSTAVGMHAIQLARAIGCTVTVSASGRKEELLRSLGAENVIDYTKGPLHEQLIRDPPSPKYHAFLEAVGTSDPALYLHCEKYLAPGGVFTSVGPERKTDGGFAGLARLLLELARPTFLGGVKRKWTVTMVDDRRDEFEEFGKYVAAGKVKAVVDSVFAFEDALEGYDRVMTRHATGKVIVKIDSTVE